MADITREQFDETKAVTKKVFQKGTFLADADLNELGDILRIGNRRMLSCLVNHTNQRFGDGFKVVGTGASLAVTIKAGFAAFLIGTEQAALLHLTEDATLSGFTAWTTSRTDYVYIDITETEISAATDPNIVNPDIGAETCRDMRLSYSFAISVGAVPGAAPSGHTYISLASITKTIGSTISAGDVTALIPMAQFLDDGCITTAKLADDAVTMAKIGADVAGDGLTQAVDGSLDVTGVACPPACPIDRVYGFWELPSGVWNMDTDASIAIAHGLSTRYLGVVSVHVMIWSASFVNGYPLTVSGSWSLDALNLTLSRTGGGFFDNSNFSVAIYRVVLFGYFAA